MGDLALVFTTAREPGWTTPEGDLWTVYSVSVRTANFRKLVNGYALHVATWLKFVPGHDDELAITYLSCWECEPASPSPGVASIGTWYHSRDLTTGKLTSTARKFLVDSSTGEERSLTLSGAAAERWERALCKPAGAVPDLLGGQSSRSCKQLLQPARAAKKR